MCAATSSCATDCMGAAGAGGAVWGSSDGWVMGSGLGACGFGAAAIGALGLGGTAGAAAGSGKASPSVGTGAFTAGASGRGALSPGSGMLVWGIAKG